MNATAARLPRTRALLLIITSIVGMATVVALKLCHEKYQLYREYARYVVIYFPKYAVLLPSRHMRLYMEKFAHVYAIKKKLTPITDDRVVGLHL